MSKQVNGHEIIQMFESFYPKKFAIDGDPIGLQTGRLNRRVSKVMVALDVLDQVVDEAIEEGAELIIAHHPLMYRPLKKLDLDQPEGQLLEKLIKHDITVYAAHTNLDVAKGGVNDLLAEALGLEGTEVLVPTYEEELRKLIVFVPEEHAESMRDALGNAGAGSIGDYSHCSFSAAGTGRFLPGEGADPFIGKKGKPEEVKEIRLETIYPAHLEKNILTEMLRAHPYEEPAYDLYPLKVKGETLGLGRIGVLPRDMSLGEFAEHVKEVLSVKGLRFVGNPDTRIRKVAVLGGDGNKYFRHAKRKGADVYVTGDFYYHTAHDAISAGLNIVDPGHHVEKVMKKGVAEQLAKQAEKLGYDVNFMPSNANTDPFTFV